MRRQRGITLIALIVTIIILIILAGISINLVLGEDGIIKKAQDARKEINIASLKEEIKLKVVGEEIKNNGESLTKNKLKEIFEEYFENVPEEFPDDLSTLTLITKSKYGNYSIKASEIVNEKIITVEEMKGKAAVTKKTTITDVNGNKIKIPTNFKLASDSGTTVQQGIVIEDKEGNQYVWIPVSGDNTKVIYKDNKESFVNLLARRDFDNVVDEVGNIALNGFWGACYTETIDNTYAKNLTGFLTKSKENGGFYIGRYEAGKDENGNLVISSNAKEIYNNTTLSNSQQATQTLEQELKYSTITTDIVNSFAWDTTLNYMKMCNETFDPTELVNYGEATDKNVREDACKIYDIISNHNEYCTEYSMPQNSYTTYNVVARGGKYTGQHGSDSAKGRSPAEKDYQGNETTFRTILYFI